MDCAQESDKKDFGKKRKLKYSTKERRSNIVEGLFENGKHFMNDDTLARLVRYAPHCQFETPVLKHCTRYPFSQSRTRLDIGRTSQKIKKH